MRIPETTFARNGGPSSGSLIHRPQQAPLVESCWMVEMETPLWRELEEFSARKAGIVRSRSEYCYRSHEVFENGRRLRGNGKQ